MQRYVLWVRVDGSRFTGFAKSGGNGFGVMDLISGLIKHVLVPKGFTGIQASPGSRTDAGVHVLRSPIIINTIGGNYRIDDTQESKTEIIEEMNDTLSKIDYEALKVLDIHRVSKGFSLRRNVSYRRYVYRLRVSSSMDVYDNCKILPSISCFAERFHSWTLPPNFDLQKAQAAASAMQGLHNMASFFRHPRGQRDKTLFNERRTYRSMELVQVTPGEPISDIPDPLHQYYNFEVVSRSFLREQIRRMVEVVVSHAQGKLSMREIKELLVDPHPDRFSAMKLKAAPPHGLYLVDCVYDPQQFTHPVPYNTHGWDEEDELDALD